MFLKSDILLKLSTLQSYCEQNKQSNVSGDFAGMIEPLKSAVNAYFDNIPNGLKYDFMNYITQIATDIQKRYTTYENQFGPDLPINYPQGYMDLGEIFANGAIDQLMGISGSEFLAGFPIVAGEGGSTSSYDPNPIIETWIGEIENAHGSESTKIKKIIEFCESNLYNDGLISMFEDRGNMTVHITNEELARNIYLDKGAKAVIQNFNLDIYVPSYI